MADFTTDPFEAAPQVCSRSISALSSCKTRSNILYYLGRAARSECRGHNEKIQYPISTAKYLTSKLKWKMKLRAWREAGKGLQCQGTQHNAFPLIALYSLQSPADASFHWIFHLMSASSSLLHSEGLGLGERKPLSRPRVGPRQWWWVKHVPQ